MIGMITVVLLVAVLTALLWSYYNQLTFFGKLGLDGPRPLPIFGNMFDFRVGVQQAIEKWTKIYGKTFGISRGAKKVIVTSDVAFAREVMVKQFKNFGSRMDFPLRPDLMKFDLLTLSGHRWKNLREIVSGTFSKTKMQRMVPLVAQCADETIQIMDDASNEKNGVMNLHEMMAIFGIDVGALCFFASKLGTPEEKSSIMHQSNRIWLRFKTVYVPWILIILFPWVESFCKFIGCAIHPNDSVEFFSNMLRDIMASRRKDPGAAEYRDFLQLMINANFPVDSGDPNGQPAPKRGLTDNEIFSMCMSFFTGSTETSPSTLAFALYCLAAHPDVQERVIREVDEVIKGDVTLENMNALTYMDMAIREVLRLYPTVANLSRTADEDCVIQGIKIPKGTSVDIAVYAIHTDSANWPDPMAFDPERFSPENKGKIDPVTWLAFGQGPRMCIGYRFAMMEVLVMLARLLKKYRVETCQDTENPPKRGFRGLMTPINGVYLRLVKRQDVVAS